MNMTEGPAGSNRYVRRGVTAGAESPPSTSLEDTIKKHGLRGALASIPQKIDKVINGEKVEMLPPSVKKASREATADDFRAGLHNEDATEKHRILGVDWNRWRHKTKEVSPKFEDVYTRLESWWSAFAKRQMQLYPPETHPFGPGEHSPMYFKWQMARQFYKDGQVQVNLIQKAFADDVQFYNTTMMMIEHEATLKMHALGMKKEFERSFTQKNVLKKNTVGRSGSVVEMVEAAYELDGTLLVAIGTIALTCAVTGTPIPAFLAGAAMNAVGAGVALGGGVAVWELGKDGIKRMIDGVRKNGDIRIFTKSCATSLELIQKDDNVCDYMKDMYQLSPKDVTIAANGELQFTGGTTSNSWEGIQKDLDSDIRLREMFLTDLVCVDTKRAHALTEQFLTEWEVKKGWNLKGAKNVKENRFIVNQTGSRYEGEVLKKFDTLRREGSVALGISAGIPLDHAHTSDLQKLYMEASKQVLAERANIIFADTLQTILDQAKDGDEVASSEATITHKKQGLAKGVASTDGKTGEDGWERKELKKEADKKAKEARELTEGVDAKDGIAAKSGLKQMRAELETGSPENPGLVQRRTTVETTYKELSALLRTEGLLTEARKVSDEQSLSSIEIAMVSTKGKIDYLEKTAIPPVSKTGTLRAGEESRLKIETVNINKATYSGKSAVKDKEDDLARVLATYKERTEEIDKTHDTYKQQLEQLIGLMTRLQEKRNELEKQYDALKSQRPDRDRIASHVDSMRGAYTTVTTGKFKLTEKRLQDYGMKGNLIDNYCSTLHWIAPKKDQHENRLMLLQAAAEAKARASFLILAGVDLHSAPTSVHVEIANFTGIPPGVLTPEQLVVMSPHQVMEIMDARTPPPPEWAKLTTPAAKLAEIRSAQNIETLRYETRKKALDDTMKTHGLVVDGLQKSVTDIDKQCEARLDQFKLIEKFLADRGDVYKEAPRMAMVESLRTYAVLESVASSTKMTPDEKEGYTLTEISAKVPKGFQDFLRDIFKYHLYKPEIEIEGNSSEKLYLVLIDALGGPAEAQTRVANTIVKAFPSPPGFDAFITGVDKNALTFNQVMQILLYRSDPHPPPPPNAIPILVPSRLSTQEMLFITQSIAKTIANRAMGSGIK